MLITFLILLATIFLAYANGANDNFKGVATLFGSGTSDYKKALWWATLTTFFGSLSALFITHRFLINFSGKGLFADNIVVNNPLFLFSVGLGAASTVFLATRLGLPVSTTHSLVGALLGAGLVAVPDKLNLPALGNIFFLPLLLSPFISALLAFILYPCFRFIRIKLGIEKAMCLCVGNKLQEVCIQADGAAILKSTGLSLTFDEVEKCEQTYLGKIFCFDAQALMDKLHFVSAGIVGFARGLNDTPKILALLLAINILSIKTNIFIIGITMAVGGLISAQRVAWTMSKKITRMNHGQGFSANLITSLLVIFASGLGLPVSTTHVSCGSLFGIGLVNKKTNWSIIGEIILAWFLTLPLAAILSGLCFLIIKNLT